ncbi:hypothetical protein DUI87_00072 [Hirundo rustica rustica]|uniref:Zinc transporter ZIP5 n=1 Tax=Hirundo rustica rustica TaxID=333673 RepID=A0A3M0LD01_HIRRU|nr:hypothetical protein DUI87_00072 [Hirundo rustica rustica]
MVYSEVPNFSEPNPEYAAQQAQGKGLFGQYGSNGTLPSEGLARLLGSLGLGRVRVVRIQHEELGHAHASHLDVLEVQEEKHRHRHPLREHGEHAPSTPEPRSLPSALAVPLVPLLGRSSLRSLLSFLVALAVGTLCGDALLHLWPHAQGPHPETPGEPSPAVLQGLAVLGGIYALFLLELLLGMLRSRREATLTKKNNIDNDWVE